MARYSRSGRFPRRTSRTVIAFLVVGCLLLTIYYFNPLRSSEAAPGADQHSSAVASDADVPRPTTVSPRRGERTGEQRQPAGGGSSSGSVESAAPGAPAPRVTVDNVAQALNQGPATTATAPRTTFLTDARRLQDEGKLLEAREILNNALQSGTLDHKTCEETKARLRDLNHAIVFTPTRRFSADPFQGEHIVQPGENLTRIARPLHVPWEFIARINGVRPDRIRAGQSLKTIQGPIHAVVSKTHFTMDLYLGALPGEPGSMYLTTFRVGLGEDNSTPTGLWEVTRGSKLVDPEWTNPRTNEVIRSGDPENPLGVRWIGLTGIAGDALGQPSYGIHGTIEPETIGTNASMGCIRLDNADAIQVYEMLTEGRSTVRIID